MSKLIFNTNYKKWFIEVSKHIKSHYPMPYSEANKGNVCFDIGCNVGAFTCAYNKHFDKVVSVEASKSNIEEIARNVNERSIKNVTLMHNAVYSKSNEAKVLKFWRDKADKHCGNSSIIDYYDESKKHGWTDEEGESVNTISLEDLHIQYGHADYMKVDIEGGEYDFLMNKDLSNITYLSIELHVQLREKKEELKQYLLKYFDIQRQSFADVHELLYLKHK